MGVPPEISPLPGQIAPEVEGELPGLSLRWATLTARDGGSPPELVARLAQLANGFRGAAVIALRTKPVPAAYRNFFRQIGLDPDVDRPPGEQAALSRLFDGTFRSHGQVADALLIALLETGVPVRAFDAHAVRGEELRIRTAEAGERLGRASDAPPLTPGTLVLADGQRVHSVLFGQCAPDAGVNADTRELLLYAVSVEGVPAIHVEEAFWLAAEALRNRV